MPDAMPQRQHMHDDPAGQPLLSTIEKAQTLAQLIIAVWPLARVLALHILEYVFAERTQRPVIWPPCPCCGSALCSKGFAPRQLRSTPRLVRWYSSPMTVDGGYVAP
jgi:hypothetical protein